MLKCNTIILVWRNVVVLSSSVNGVTDPHSLLRRMPRGIYTNQNNTPRQQPPHIVLYFWFTFNFPLGMLSFINKTDQHSEVFKRIYCFPLRNFLVFIFFSRLQNDFHFHCKCKYSDGSSLRPQSVFYLFLRGIQKLSIILLLPKRHSCQKLQALIGVPCSAVESW